MKRKFKKFLIGLSTITGIALLSSPIIVACSSNNDKDNNNTNKVYNDQTIIDNIKSGFANNINSENFMMKFDSLEKAKNELSILSNNLLTSSEIAELGIDNVSNSDDINLKLLIKISLNNGHKIEFNLDTNVINVDSIQNKQKFIYDTNNNSTIIGLSDQFGNDNIIYLPSDVKTISFPSNFATNNSNITILNFTFAKSLITISNDDTFKAIPNLEIVNFYGCKNLKQLPRGLFSKCTKLKEINFSNCISLNFINDWFADHCVNLENVNFSGCKSLNEIGGYSFDGCSSLREIDLSQTSNIWNGIWQYAFANCSNLRSINLTNISIIKTLKNTAFDNNVDKIIEINSANFYYKIKECGFTKINFNNIEVGPYDINKTIATKQYNENAFLENAIDVANDNNAILYYNVNNSGVMHTYGTLAHILKVLEINPNKEIHLFLSKKVWTDGTKKQWDLDVLNKFPNVHFDYMNDYENQGLSYNFILQYAQEILQHGIDSTKRNIMYIADVNFNWCARGSINDSNVLNITSEMKDNLTNTYFNLIKNFNQINIIPDGTMSTDAYSNKLYDLYKSGNKLFEFNKLTGRYENLINLQIELSKFSSDEFRKWLDQNALNPWYYLTSLFVSNNDHSSSNIPQVNYYLQATNLVKDVNNASSTQFNDNVIFNDYFDPYNSMGANLIEFMQSLNNDSRTLFSQITKTEQVSQKFFDEFKDHTNIIYGGNKMDNNDWKITSEANKLIKLVKMNDEKFNNVIVWFKGHPRDTNNYDQLLIKKISQLVDNDQSIVNKQDFKNKIKILNKNIPLEMYAASGLFSNDESQHRIVKQYLGYTTYALSVIAYDVSTVMNIILSDQNIKDIQWRFGKIGETLCFPSNLVINEKDFLG